MKKRVPEAVAKVGGVVGGAWWWLRSWVKDHLLGVSLAIMVAGLVGGVAVTAVDPGWVGGGESGSTTLRNLGFVVAGLIALPLAVWRAQVADQQARAAQQQAETAQRQAETAQRQEETAQRQAETAQRQAETAQMDLRHRRYQEGIAMLRSDVLSECLTGIDALRRLAEEYPREYHIRIMKLLCACLRHPSEGWEPVPVGGMGEEGGSPSGGQLGGWLAEQRADAQAALAAISNCHGRQLELEHKAEFRLDLRSTDFRGTVLPSVNLSNALLSSANLVDVYMVSWNLADADLSGADLTDANLRRTDLSGASLFLATLTRADFTGSLAANPAKRAIRPPASAGDAAIGMTQGQLADARADPNNPPWLDGVNDAETGKQLVWRGKTPDGQPHPKPDDAPDD